MTDQTTRSPARGVATAMLWAATWGIGAAIGVALGGWLTVAGGSGAPGVASLDITQDVIVLPAAAGVAVFVLHLAGNWAVTARNRRRSR